MAEVTGSTTAKVNVSKKEMFEGLCKDLGVYQFIFEEPDDGYYKVTGDMIFLFENMAHHGSPKYQITWELRNSKLADIYTTMMELKKYIYD